MTNSTNKTVNVCETPKGWALVQRYEFSWFEMKVNENVYFTLEATEALDNSENHAPWIGEPVSFLVWTNDKQLFRADFKNLEEALLHVSK